MLSTYVFRSNNVDCIDQYHIGYTMRFPRALSIRDDLSIGECMTASELIENMRSNKKRKMEAERNVQFSGNLYELLIYPLGILICYAWYFFETFGSVYNFVRIMPV